MNPFIKKSLLSFGRYVASETIKELEVIPYIKAQIKSSLFYSVSISKRYNGTFFNAIEKYLLETYPEKFSNVSFENYVNYNSPDGLKKEREIQQVKTIIKECGGLIYINKKIDKTPNSYCPEEITFSVLKQYQNSLEAFFEKIKGFAIKKNPEILTTSLYTYEGDSWNRLKEYTPIPLENIYLPKEIKDNLITDLDTFFAKKDWYVKKGITVKRGYLLYGAPRNGKSSIITAIAAKYSLYVYYLNLNSFMSDAQLMKAIKNIPTGSIVAIEEIDTVWNKRSAKSENCKINIETFMNILSGSYERDGLIFIFTTNFIDDLDEALIGDRRIDMKIHIDNPKKSEVEAYLSNLYEFPVELASYEDRSRSMGNILNLFLKYSENHLELCKILENA